MQRWVGPGQPEMKAAPRRRSPVAAAGCVRTAREVGHERSEADGDQYSHDARDNAKEDCRDMLQAGGLTNRCPFAVLTERGKSDLGGGA